MPVAELLPQTIFPYMTMMVVGFALGVFGHMARSRLLIAIGIALIFLATLLFPIAINITGENPGAPPGPVPSP